MTSPSVQAELQLAEQAALLDLADDAILVRTLEGKILFWNHGAGDLWLDERQSMRPGGAPTAAVSLFLQITRRAR